MIWTIILKNHRMGDGVIVGSSDPMTHKRLQTETPKTREMKSFRVVSSCHIKFGFCSCCQKLAGTDVRNCIKFHLTIIKLFTQYMYYIYTYVCCESEVITWILPVPLDYILVEMVDGFAVVSDTTCAPFDRTYAVWGS